MPPKWIDQRLAELLIATFTVVESTDPAVSPGETAEGIISTQGKTHQQVQDGFRRCEKPHKPPFLLLAQMIGIKTTCGAGVVIHGLIHLL